MKNAAIILIGNELLTGKIRDENGYYLMRRLRGLGVELGRLVVVPDVEGEIVAELRHCSTTYDFVFTSGGVGPTHDDITLESIAAAFGVGIERNPTIETVLRDHFQDRITPAHLRMADLPVGMTLLEDEAIRWPVLVYKNVYVLPGIPQLFRAKFEAIADRFRHGQFFLRSLYLQQDEAEIATLLADVEREHGVSIGSYPRWGGADYRLRITIESRDAATVDNAAAALLAGLDPNSVVRFDAKALPADSPDMIAP